MKTTFTSILVICLALLLCVNALANVPESIELRYTHLSGLTANLSISGTTAQVSGRITPKNGQKTTLTVKLQQKVDGRWKTIATWSDSSSSGTSDIISKKSVDKGYAYRAYATGKVYNSAGSVIETASKASATKTC